MRFLKRNKQNEQNYRALIHEQCTVETKSRPKPESGPKRVLLKKSAEDYERFEVSGQGIILVPQSPFAISQKKEVGDTISWYYKKYKIVEIIKQENRISYRVKRIRRKGGYNEYK